MELILAILIGLIPASIAKSKGYSFGLWWFYGRMLFIVAIIHVALIPNKNAAVASTGSVPPVAPTGRAYTAPAQSAFSGDGTPSRSVSDDLPEL